MKEGAILGALAAFFVYMLLPIYGASGQVNLIPTANVVSNPSTMASYVNNLPFSMVVFFSLEVLGISAGVAAQVVLKKSAL